MKITNFYKKIYVFKSSPKCWKTTFWKIKTREFSQFHCNENFQILWWKNTLDFVVVNFLKINLKIKKNSKKQSLFNDNTLNEWKMRDDDVGIRKKSKMVYEENTVKTV